MCCSFALILVRKTCYGITLNYFAFLVCLFFNLKNNHPSIKYGIDVKCTHLYLYYPEYSGLSKKVLIIKSLDNRDMIIDESIRDMNIYEPKRFNFVYFYTDSNEF